MRVSWFSEAISRICFGVVSAIACHFLYLLIGDQDQFAMICLHIIGGGGLIFLGGSGVCRLKYYILSENGISHRIFGIAYRTTLWEDICDIMCLRDPTERSKQPFLVINCNPDKIHRPKNSMDRGLMHVEFKNDLYVDWLRGDVFFLRCGKEQMIHEVIPFVRLHYGEMDYSMYSESK